MWRRVAQCAGSTARVHRVFIASTMVSLLLFGWLGTSGTGRVFSAEPFGDFFEYQAASLLQGRLDVPPEALTWEAFVYQGKHYAYFGPTPALLRVPFVLTGIGHGRLTLPFMLAAFTAALLAAYLILLHARKLASAPHPVPRGWLVGLLVTNAGVANTFLFLSSRAYVYHEAILCGAAFCLWSVWCSLRHFAAPAGRWWIGAVACGFLAVHARPPTGLFALTTVGVVACALLFRAWQSNRGRPLPTRWAAVRSPLLLGIAATLSVLSFNGLSYLKFRTFNGCPLEYHVQYDAARIARFEGKQFHLSNIPFGAAAYLVQPNFERSKFFPYVQLGPGSQAKFPNAKMDLVEPMLAFPYAMPALFLLGTAGCAWTWWSRRELRPAVALVWIAAVPMILVMFAAVAHSHRYTADFCPVLIVGAAFACATLEDMRATSRRVVAVLLAPLSLVAVGVGVLLTLHYRGETVWGVPAADREHYAALRQRADAFFGQPNPAGYDARKLRVQSIDVGYYSWLLDALVKKKEAWPRAISVYENFLRAQTFQFFPHVVVADVYVALNQPAKATEALSRGLTLEPKYAKGQAQLAELLMQAGEVTRAIEHYKMAVQFFPTYVVAHNNLGVAYAQIGRMEEAIRHLERAHELNPDYPDARNNLEKLRAQVKRVP